MSRISQVEDYFVLQSSSMLAIFGPDISAISFPMQSSMFALDSDAAKEFATLLQVPAETTALDMVAHSGQWVDITPLFLHKHRKRKHN